MKHIQRNTTNYQQPKSVENAESGSTAGNQPLLTACFLRKIRFSGENTTSLQIMEVSQNPDFKEPCGFKSGSVSLSDVMFLSLSAATFLPSCKLQVTLNLKYNVKHEQMDRRTS